MDKILGVVENESGKTTPLGDLMEQALYHYEEASDAIAHWNSSVPLAIKFYFAVLILSKKCPNNFEFAEEVRKLAGQI